MATSPPQHHPASSMGVLLLLDVPCAATGGYEGMTFQVDAYGFDVTPATRKFSGILLPPGLHLLSYSSGPSAPRSAFFLEVSAAAPGHASSSASSASSSALARTIHARKWDATTETFVRDPSEEWKADAPPPQGLAAAAALAGAMNDALVPYPDDGCWEIWCALTNHVDHAVLAHCGVPVDANIHPGDPDAADAQARWAHAPSRRRAMRDGSSAPDDAKAMSDAITPHHADAERAAVFPQLDAPPEGSSPAAVSAFYIDPSASVDAMLASVYGGSEKRMVGTFQLAFVLFLYVHSYHAYYHWKACFILLCRCEDLVLRRPNLFRMFVESAKVQLAQVDSGFFAEFEGTTAEPSDAATAAMSCGTEDGASLQTAPGERLDDGDVELDADGHERTYEHTSKMTGAKEIGGDNGEVFLLPMLRRLVRTVRAAKQHASRTGGGTTKALESLNASLTSIADLMASRFGVSVEQDSDPLVMEVLGDADDGEAILMRYLETGRTGEDGPVIVDAETGFALT
ncbi:A1 cistron-splicing factor AAR2 [Pycnococcus provasolii]